MSAAQPPLPPRAAAPPALPPGFIAQTDPATGKVFFVNTATGQSQWEHPSAPAAPPALPPGFFAQTDHSTGKVFYVNTATGQSQWDFPSAPAQYAAPPVQQASIVPVAGAMVVAGSGQASGNTYAQVGMGPGGPSASVTKGVGNNGTSVTVGTNGPSVQNYQAVQVNDKTTLVGGVRLTEDGLSTSATAKVEVSPNTDIYVGSGGPRAVVDVAPGTQVHVAKGGATMSKQMGNMRVNVSKDGVSVGLGSLRIPLRKA
ncbi:hypothetical protein DFJ74DRAFT_710730 [Hyaloraphidium curvatum]|nr:hypothetical protein DFJ74DRAFT_710730 [Hyaloraphidium curvatum]